MCYNYMTASSDRGKQYKNDAVQVASAVPCCKCLAMLSATSWQKNTWAKAATPKLFYLAMDPHLDTVSTGSKREDSLHEDLDALREEGAKGHDSEKQEDLDHGLEEGADSSDPSGKVSLLFITASPTRYHSCKRWPLRRGEALRGGH